MSEGQISWALWGGIFCHRLPDYVSIVHSAMHSDACPSYLLELVARHAPPIAQRAATDRMLLSVIYIHRCLAAGDNALSVCGPRLCNDISLFHTGKPSHKQLLKEFLTRTFSIFISVHELFPAIIWYKFHNSQSMVMYIILRFISELLLIVIAMCV